MTFQKKKNQEKLSQFHIFHNFFPDFLSLQATEKLHFLHFFLFAFSSERPTTHFSFSHTDFFFYFSSSASRSLRNFFFHFHEGKIFRRGIFSIREKVADFHSPGRKKNASSTSRQTACNPCRRSCLEADEREFVTIFFLLHEL